MKYRARANLYLVSIVGDSQMVFKATVNPIDRRKIHSLEVLLGDEVLHAKHSQIRIYSTEGKHQPIDVKPVWFARYYCDGEFDGMVDTEPFFGHADCVIGIRELHMYGGLAKFEKVFKSNPSAKRTHVFDKDNECYLIYVRAETLSEAISLVKMEQEFIDHNVKQFTKGEPVTSKENQQDLSLKKVDASKVTVTKINKPDASKVVSIKINKPDASKSELHTIMNELKAICTQENIAIVTGHQLNRAAASESEEKNTDVIEKSISSLDLKLNESPYGIQVLTKKEADELFAVFYPFPVGATEGYTDGFVGISMQGVPERFYIKDDPDEEKRISKIDYYLSVAEVVAKRGTCLRRNFGAVIVKDDSIVSTGYTGAPRGRKNCIDIGTCIRNEMGVERGTRYELCRSCHAEMNAVIHASREEMKDATLYLVGIERETGELVENADCCMMCKRVIINSGIKQVIIKNSNDSRMAYKIINTSHWVENDDSLDMDHKGY